MPHIQPACIHRATAGCRFAAIALVTALAVHATSASAAKIYRCGNVFQDLPCPEAKAPEPRPAERTAPLRDATPCGVTKETIARSDCIARTSTRESQSDSAVATKR